MSKKLTGQVAWITGGASGMGRATAQLFASEGASIAIVDINEALGNEVTEEINASGGEAIFCRCNVSSETDVQSAIAATVDRFGGLQIIFNCAAKGIAKRLENMTEAEWDELMAVNVKSIFFSLKHGIQHLEKNQHSYVVNIGSISSFVAQVDTPAYTTTKGAVLLLSQSIALDYAHLGLRCNCLCPGLTDTPMSTGYYDRIVDGDKFLAQRIRRIPINRMVAPEEVARSALFFSCEDSAGITGTSLTIDGGYLAAAEWDCNTVTQL
jgi:NAD(P)-dependent dehydrogenase (short-subunit alcohol dehydrogenase family)